MKNLKGSARFVMSIIMLWNGPESERFGGLLFSTSFLSKSLCKKVRFVGVDQARAEAHIDGSQDEHKDKAKLRLIKIIYFSVLYYSVLGDQGGVQTLHCSLVVPIHTVL